MRLEASTYKKAPNHIQKLLIDSGVLIVNDIYLPLWENASILNLLYGSYGSGKSVVIIDRLIDKCLNNDFFRCYYGRKVLQDVRGSVHKTIIDRIKERRLTSKFNYSDAPNGTMHVICKENGNEFIPFGSENAENLKSIKDPTDIFCEELNQFTFDDFTFIFSRLRKEGVVLQFWGAFNTDKVYQSHWIRKQLFDGQFADMADKLKCNFTHNFFINQEQYFNQLRLLSGGDGIKLNAIAYGEWGMVRTGQEFWKSFDEALHVKPVAFDNSTTIHISIDENVNPYVTQTMWQVSTEKREIKQFAELLSRSPNNNAPRAAKQMTEYLNRINYKDVVYVYGDPSGGKRSTIDENNRSFFDKYISELRQVGFTVVSRVQRSAPEVSLSGAFINDIYAGKLGWSIIIGDMCFESIEDYLLVVEDMEGKMLKIKVKDKESGVTYEKNGHISDTKRYFITTILSAEFEQYKSKGKRRGVTVVPGAQ
jgi:PBSX family phage terminase large subunit